MTNTNKLILSLLAGAVLSCVLTALILLGNNHISDPFQLLENWWWFPAGMAGGGILYIALCVYIMFYIGHFFLDIYIIMSIFSIIVLPLALGSYTKKKKTTKLNALLVIIAFAFWCTTGFLALESRQTISTRHTQAAAK